MDGFAVQRARLTRISLFVSGSGALESRLLNLCAIGWTEINIGCPQLGEMMR